MLKSLILTVLITQLGDPSFAVRETAHSRLLKSLPAAGPYLLAARSAHDPEIAARCHRLFDAWAWEAAEKWEVPDWPALPWIDAWPVADPCRYQHIQYWLSVVDQNDLSGAPEWPKYRLATKLWIASELRAGTPPKAIHATLNRMADYDAKWILQNQKSYQFPQSLLHAAEKRIKSVVNK